MADARTKLDILYQDVLGDVSDLIKRIELIEGNIPEIGESIRKEADRLENALATLKNGMNDAAVQIDQRIALSVENSRAKAENSLNEFSDGLAQELVKTLDGIAEDIFATVEAFKSSQNDHQQAAKNVVESLGRLETSVKQMLVDTNRAVRSSNPSWAEKKKEFMLVGLGSGLLAGIISGIILGFILK